MTAVMLAVGVVGGVQLASAPSAAAQPTRTTTIASGFGHACAIRVGKAYCWGDNSGGALGNGSVVDSYVPTPVSTAGALNGKTLTQITAGSGFTCALDSAGAAYCWGSNAYGQLGINSALSSAPVAVSTSTLPVGVTFTQISAGENHACALGSNGVAYCWGDNTYGQLGNGSAASRSSAPVAVASAVAFTQISAGGSTTCALDSTGAAYCWGRGGSGQLGNGASSNSSVPVAVDTTVRFSQISVGYTHVCALNVTSPYAPWCWGHAARGDLGIGGADGQANQTRPMAVTATGVLAGKVLKQISSGYQSSCVLDTAGLGYCWGYNYFGQVGVAAGNGTNQFVPVAVLATGTAPAVGVVLYGKTLSQISAGGNVNINAAANPNGGFTCAQDSASGAPYCWGYNGSGSLGNPSIAACDIASRAIPTGRTAGCRATPMAVNAPMATTISAGNLHSCAIRRGLAYCWGTQANGALGNGTTSTTATQNAPVAVSTTGVLSGKTLTQISAGGTPYDPSSLGSTSTPAGGDHTCALDSTGAAYCWGWNQWAQLGNGSSGSSATSNVPVAVTVSGLPTGRWLTQIIAGGANTCAIDTAGVVYCGGPGHAGQLGQNSMSGPSGNVLNAVRTNSGDALYGKVLVGITVGLRYACAIDTAGAAYCWGEYGTGYSKIGSGTNGSGSTCPGAACAPLPVRVSTGAMTASTVLVSIAAGYNSTCALDDAGKAYCWGLNDVGQLGAVTNPSTIRIAAGKFGNAVNLTGGTSGPYVSMPPGILSGLRNFTISVWVRPNAAPAAPWPRVFDFGSGPGVNMFLTVAADSATGAIRFAITTGGSGSPPEQRINGAGQLTVGVWSHVAVTLSGPTGNSGPTGTGCGTQTPSIPANSNCYTGTLYVNGVAPATPTNPNTSITLTPADLGDMNQNWIGRSQYPADQYLNAAIDDFHIYDRALSATEIAALYNSGTGTPGAGNVASYNFNEALNSGPTVLDSSGHGRNATIVSPVASSNVPVAVETSGALAGKSLAQIAVGQRTACATSTDGAAYCWGLNDSGQFGNGNNGNQSVPTPVTTSGTPLSGAFLTQVNMENNTVCAQAATGASSCWGANGSGQLGCGTYSATTNPSCPSTTVAPTYSTTPVGVTSPGPPSSVAVFQGNGTATVYWAASALPSTATVASYTATAYPGGAYCTATAPATRCTITGLTNGISYLVTVVATGTPLGGSPVSSLAIVTPWPPARIAAGGSHACTISSGMAYCLGDNTYGQLGDGSTNASKVPVRVSTSGVLAGKTITQISAGARHTCALDSAGVAYCWGDNTYGQLGNGTATDSPVPVAVSPGVVPGGRTLTQVSAGAQHTCALDNLGAGYCWGDNSQGELGINTPGGTRTTPVAVTGALTLAQISADGTDTAPFTNHTCALTTAGAAYCWGDNSRGQVGNNTTTQQNAPVGVTGGALAGKTLAQVTTGAASSCALDAAGLAYCWGDNTYGQLGNNTITSTAQLVPVAVYTAGVLYGVTLAQVSGGYRHTCAVASNGWAYCWGFGIDGELGNGGTATTGAAVAVINNGVLYGRVLTQVSAGGSHTCVLDHDGVAYCWGHNTSGQVGNNTYTDATEPVPVSPQAPTIITPVTPVDDTAAISWNVPVFLNSGTITGYTVTATPSPSSGLPSVSCSPASGTTCTLTGLARGVTYTVTVTLTATINGVPVTSTSPPVTILIPGFLTITVPDTAPPLSDATPGGTASGQLGDVTVTDQRGTGAGSWTVSVSVTDFTSGVAPAPVHTIPATAVTYTIPTSPSPPNPFKDVDGAEPDNHTPVTFTEAAPPPAAPGNDEEVVSSGIGGTLAATWTPEISVVVPRTAVTGTYTATITHSVT